MPAFEVPVPVGVTAFAIVDDDGEEYTIVIGTDTFTRTGEDGAEIICPIFHGDEGVGEVLEGQWKKAWDANMDADQVFTAILDGSGVLEFEGEADVAGTAGNGWINGHLPIPLLGGLEIIVSMSVPVDDTGGVANRDIFFDFYLRGDKKAVDVPSGDADFIRVRFDVDETGLILNVSKEVATVNTVLDSGFDYTMDGSRSTGDLEAVVWRFVFHNGVAGATAPSNVRHMHIYMKQSDTITNAEAATENELDDSPYDISDLLFDVAYPAFQIISENTTYYDSGSEAKVGRVTVDYPDFNVKYDVPDANIALGEVELYDGDPDTTGVRVYDEDHVFSNDPYLQNGLIRVWIDELIVNGLKIYGYYGGSWIQSYGQHYPRLETSALNLTYPVLKSIVKVSSEETILKIRWVDDANDDDDFYLESNLTLRRGHLFTEFEFIETQPSDGIRFVLQAPSRQRFGYVGDDVFGDDDVGTGTSSNTTMSDNFLEALDDAGIAALTGGFMTEKPDGATKRFDTFEGGNLIVRYFDASQISTVILWSYISPFSLIANIFEEAEDATLGGGATTPGNDPNASGAGNNYVLLNAQNETVDWTFVAGTALPEGRYLAVFRALDSNQVALDFEMSVQNTSDGEYRNEEGADVHTTLTASYAYYSIVFDITVADVTGTDNIRIRAKKDTAGANSIRVDYFLIIPIGDGESFPMDLAHGALRTGTIVRRVLER